MQKTNFAFEVLVHDDASTDKTADIIREYEAKYPDIIKPIYQTENQFSQQVDIDARYQHSRSAGKYVAFCEGDDYWTDPYKLQKQVLALEMHPEIDMCAHDAIRVNAETKRTIDYVTSSRKNVILTPKQVILEKGGYIANDSLLYRKTLVEKLPAFVQRYPLDYFMHIHGSLRGGILYLSEPMSAYRWMSVGSWTSTIHSDIEKFKMHKHHVINSLDLLDMETNFRYTKTIHRAKILNILQLYRISGKIYELLKKENSEIFSALPLIAKVEVILKSYFPVIIKIRNTWDERKTQE